MHLATKIFYFIAFVVVFIGIQVANAWMLQAILKKSSADKAPSVFLVQEGSLLTNYVGFFIIIYLLTGFWSWPLSLAFVASAHLGLIFGLLLWGFLQSGETRWLARAGWAGGEWGLKNPLIMVLIGGVSILILVGYFIFAGIAYFHIDASPALTATIFQYTIVFTVFGMLISSITSMPMLLSGNVDENTRTRYLVNQIGALVPTALFLALALLFFAGQPVETAQILTVRFLPVVVLLLGYFVLSTLFPYLLGIRRARNQSLALLGQRKGWLEELWNILSKPSSAHYLERLEGVKTEIAAAEDDLARTDKMIEWGKQIDSNTAPPEIAAIVPTYLQCRDSSVQTS